MVREWYEKKRVTPERAVAEIADGSTIVHGMVCGEPPALLGALAARLRAGDLKKVRIFSLLPGKHASATYLAPDLSDCVDSFTWFVSPADRNLVRVGLNYFVPNEFHQVPRFIREFMDVDVTLTTVSPMDKNGFFTFGAVNDYISTAARACRKLIVEVNPLMPRVFGDSLLHISEVDALIEHEAPMLESRPAEAKPEAAVIGRLVAAEVPDGATIQVGFGGIPNAVCEYLLDRKDLGIHSELFCPGLAELIKKGVATGRKKTFHPRKHLFTNVLGDRELYDFVHDNPSCESYPVSYINHPANIARQDQLISINATIEVDLLGQCNSESLDGAQYSGTGGQLDFVRGAFDSKGGKSIIAFYSTARDGKVSRIVPQLRAGAVVTVPRTATHYLATEYGIVNLKGKSTRDRALAIISLAHPKFRDDLLREAENQYLI
ncbi:acetyl-CoA hydrolase/transferase family protein [Desulfatiglans anilini]|uniref:acetyl-CoA hydrolase/transferase family protein n=1 Tax=Desulfatiglans anilini TaxID=90728 RepID=UPI000420143E|nr:acetyl-CoA hydrolase/transferase C-terminal domain-containing protein [Desulfatiglans anilini]